MCIYSLVVDQGIRDLNPWKPDTSTTTTITWPNDEARIAELERKVAALEEMLRAAKIYDEELGNPDCELDSKKQKIQELADELGVEITLP